MQSIGLFILTNNLRNSVVAYIIQLLLTVGASMFLRHTPLQKHGRIHVFSTEGDPKAHKVVANTI